MIISSFKDPDTGIWLITFLDFHGKEQRTMNKSVTKAVQMAMINRLTTL